MDKLTKEYVKRFSKGELNALLKEHFGLLVDRFRPRLSERQKKRNSRKK